MGRRLGCEATTAAAFGSWPSPTAAASIAGSQYVLPVPATDPVLLSPLLSVVPGQLFAGALARARGLDPDAPHGLNKVTLVR
jgi:glucosamine--fructose-6-phosphate aminotransferase (isomerizing)